VIETTGFERWITSTGYTIQRGEGNVYDAALARVRQCFDIADTVVVSYSGGKDSTCALNLALQVARERNRLPLEVMMFDEEVIDPDTVALCEQVRTWPDIRFHWFCVPIRHTLRSQNRVWWWPWDPDEQDVWAREKPHGWEDIPAFKKGEGDIPQASEAYYAGRSGKLLEIAGIRVEESFNRRRALLGAGSWMTNKRTYIYAKPIWDWTWQDVWRAIGKGGWPYSKFYDKMYLKGITPHHQRVAPWGNVASSTQVRLWPEFYPDFWMGAIRRLPELKPQSRYGNTALYRKVQGKPLGVTWQEYTFQIIDSFNDQQTKEFWTKHVRDVVMKYAKKNTIPLPEEGAEILGKNADAGSAFQSWRRLAMIIAKNDLTGRDKT
jgi:predicted phosphoadenosine phosphosulfate sulfurtransferase